MNITQKPSPNFDSDRKPIDRIVIHWIVGNLATADAQFTKPNGTSAHYGIEDDQVHQYVQENKVAYHAGNYPMNQRSIGIEHSAAPDRPASESTYQTSGQLVGEIAKRYNIPLDGQHILRHSEVVSTQCCGTVDVDKIINIAKQQPMDDTLTKKATQFDQVLIFLKSVGYISNDNANDYLNGQFLQLITKLYNEMASNRAKAGKWDQIVIKGMGPQADSNKVEVQQLYDKIKSSGGDLAQFKQRAITAINNL